MYAVDAAHKVVDEFNSSGEFIGEITGAHTPAGKFIKPRNVAVKPSTHEVYVSDEGAHAIDIFSADEAEGPAPAPASEGASTVGAEAATLNGSVERAEGEPLSWFFRYARGSSCTGGNQSERKQLAAGEHGLLHAQAKIENSNHRPNTRRASATKAPKGCSASAPPPTSRRAGSHPRAAPFRSPRSLRRAGR